MVVKLFIGLALLCLFVGPNLVHSKDDNSTHVADTKVEKSVVVGHNAAESVDNSVDGDRIVGESESKSTPSSVPFDDDAVQDRGDRSEEAEYHVVEEDLNAQLFLNNSHAYGVLRGPANIRGLTVLDCNLYVIRNASSKVAVYNTNTLVHTGFIKITGAKDLRAIVASVQSNSLYVCDPTLKRVFQYSFTEKSVIKSWSVGGECHGISLTNIHNILVSLQDLRKIKEYTSDGIIVREINLDSSHTFLWHSIQLSSGQFIICHGVRKEVLHRVCIEDRSGLINQCYGGSSGRSVDKFNGPSNLAVDVHDNVLVADFNNNRIALLSPTLAHLGYVAIPGHRLNRPWALHLDKLNRRLYIGEFVSGRVLVLTV